MPADLLSIGEFSSRSRLSAKALRLYDGAGLLPPVHVDAASGYRWYSPRQLHQARQIALMRHLEMPLTRIRQVLDLAPEGRADEVQAYWRERERGLAAERGALDQLLRLLAASVPESAEADEQEKAMTSEIEVQVRQVPERVVLSGVRYVHLEEAGAVLGKLLGRMSRSGPGLPGLTGCPYTIYHAAVTQDSDGPVEVVRPMADLEVAERAAVDLGDVQARVERAHEIAVVRLRMADVAWPAQLPALEAIAAHARSLGRALDGPPRQIMIADWRTAGPDTLACDLAVPLAG